MRLDGAYHADPAAADAAAPEPAAPAKKPTLDQSMASLLLMTALAGGGLYLMHVRTGPAALGADIAINASEARVATFMNGGRQQLADVDRALRETNKLIESLRLKPAVRLASGEVADGAGDPFVYTPINAPSATGQAPQPSSFGSREQREAARQVAFDAARKLRLQSVLHGSARRACMINDKLYFEGQSVDLFVVEKITKDEVTIRSGEFQFRLKMGR